MEFLFYSLTLQKSWLTGAIYSNATQSSDGVTISGSIFKDNHQYAVTAPYSTAQNSCFLSNDNGTIAGTSTETANYRGNWWGAVDGPNAPSSVGTGDNVSQYVDFADFLTDGNFCTVLGDASFVLTPPISGPNLTDTYQTMDATLTDEDGQPIVGEDVTFYITSGQAIAYASNENGNYDIYLMRLDGGDAQALTDANSAQDDIEPAFSADGKKLAYASNRDGNYHIYVVDLTTSPMVPVQLTSGTHDNKAPRWSDDIPSSTIVFESNRDGNWEIYSMDADGTNQVNVSGNTSSDEHAPDLNPDGEYVIHADRENVNNNDVFIFDSAFMGEDRLTMDPNYEYHPVWSDDGRYLAYSQLILRPVGSLIYWKYGGLTVYDSQTRKTRLLLPEWALEGDIYPNEFNWSSDNARIAAADWNKILIVDTEDGDFETILSIDDMPEIRPPSDETSPIYKNFNGADWSPDNQKLVVLYFGNLYIYDFQTDSVNLLTSYTGSNAAFYPTWSPISDEILYLEYSSGTYNLNAIRSDGTGQIRVLSGNAGWPAWSSDGLQVALTSRVSGGYILKVADYDYISQSLNNITDITTTYQYIFTPSFYNNNQDITFTTTHFTGGFDFDLASATVIAPDETIQPVTRLTEQTHQQTYAKWSPDGRYVAYEAAFTELPANNLYIYDTQTRLEHQVTVDISATDVNWSPTGDVLIFVADGDLYTVNPDGTNLIRLVDNGYIASPDWSLGQLIETHVATTDNDGIATISYTSSSARTDYVYAVVNSDDGGSRRSNESVVVWESTLPSDAVCLDWRATSGATDLLGWQSLEGTVETSATRGLHATSTGQATVYIERDAANVWDVWFYTNATADFQIMQSSTTPVVGSLGSAVTEHSGGNYSIGEAYIALSWDASVSEADDFFVFCYVDADDPDLVAGVPDTTTLVTNPQSLQLSGTLQATVSNASPTGVNQPFQVTFFEDANGNHTWERNSDRVLGVTTVSSIDALETITVEANANGQVRFVGNAIYVVVDSLDLVAESNEDNNINTTEDVCVVDPTAYSSFSASNVELEYSYGLSFDDKFANGTSWEGGSYSPPVAVDLDNDGTSELLLGYNYHNGSSRVSSIVALRMPNTPGASPEKIFEITDSQYISSASGYEYHFAAADVDLDGYIEIVAIGEVSSPEASPAGDRLVIYDHQGNLETWWTFKENALDPSPMESTPALEYIGWWPQIMVANIDQQGHPEIIVGDAVYDISQVVESNGYQDAAVAIGTPANADGNSGTVSIVPIGANGVDPNKWGSITNIVDINLDGIHEIILGSQVYQYDPDNHTLTPMSPSFWSPRFEGQPVPASLPLGWEFNNTVDGFTATGNFDNDAYPEVILVHYQHVFLLDNDGMVLHYDQIPVFEDREGNPHDATNHTIPSDNVLYGGPPSIADFDGDGFPEVGVMGPMAFTVFNLAADDPHYIANDISWTWEEESPDPNNPVPSNNFIWEEYGLLGAIAFDFNADGASEFVIRDEHAIRVYSFYDDPQSANDPIVVEIYVGDTHPVDGWGIFSLSAYDSPIVANIDDDPEAELIVPTNIPRTKYFSSQFNPFAYISNTTQYPLYPGSASNATGNIALPITENSTFGVLIFEAGGTDEWAPARPVWNQHNFHGANIADDGSVPLVEPRNWTTFNNFRENMSPNACPPQLPDLTVSIIDTAENGSNVDVTVRVGNGGSRLVDLAENPVYISLYNDNGGNPVYLSGTATQLTQNLGLGQYEDIVITIPTATDALPLGVGVDTDASGVLNAGAWIESNELNNYSASQAFLTTQPNSAPTVHITAPADSNTAPTTSVAIASTDTVALSADITDAYLPASELNYRWSFSYTGDNVGQAVFTPSSGTSATSPVALSQAVEFSAPGDYTLTLTADDGILSTQASITVTVEFTDTPPASPPAALSCPQVLGPDQLPNHLISPVHLTEINEPTPIALSSTVDLDNVTVVYFPASNPDEVVELGVNLRATGGNTLATFDPTVIPNDSYVICVVGMDGQTESASAALVNVVGENKPGRVRFTVVDFTVPVTGLPITIGRTYDSLDRNVVGDFGYGWTLAIGNPRLEVAADHSVTMTMPDGRRSTFYFTPSPAGQGIAGVLPFFTPAYTAEPGVYGTLELVDSECAFVTLSSGQYFCDISRPYAPSRFKYIDPYGREFIVGEDGSLESIRDLNGNELIFSPDGIRSSNGDLYVPFVRDALGRITQITDPMGQVYTYNYDTNGDLDSVDMPESTNMDYDYFTEGTWNHLIKDITDPRGNTAATTTYYDDGRLKLVTDAVGLQTHYTYDLMNNQTTVKQFAAGVNPDSGTPLTVESYTYNNGGYVLRETDPLGRVTAYTYDENNNELSITVDADGLALTTRYTYDSRGNRVSTTNALGVTIMTLQYNQYGGPTLLQNALGHTYNFGYNAQYLPDVVDDQLGTLGGYVWDSRGNPTVQFDGVNARQYMTYNEYGNLVSQTDAAGRVTTTEYDLMGRQTSQIAPNGGTTTMEYDALGRMTRIVDPRGTRTDYDYDANGNQTAIYVYDALGVLKETTTYTYDNMNRMVTMTAPDGIVTRYGYDELGRQTISIVNYVDGASSTNVRNVTSETIYDAAGQMIATLDPNGIETRYEYDGAGRQVRTIQNYVDGVYSAAAPDEDLITQTVYDADGRVTSVIDANGTETRFTYDAVGRRVTTIQNYEDGVFEANEPDRDLISRTSYDIRGRATVVSDPNFRPTRYAYDADNRLIAVTNPANETVSYTYTVADELRTITDGRGNVTFYGYDNAGYQNRVIRNYSDGVHTPGGADDVTETMVYNSAGEMTAHTLGDGTINTFTYDYRGRVTVANYGSNTASPFSYTYVYNITSGTLQSVTDSRGTTTYGYDALRRPTLIDLPDDYYVEYDYNVYGQRTRMEVGQPIPAPTHEVFYGYDDLQRLISVQSGADTTTYDFDAVGLLTEKTLPNGVTATYAYDESYRVEQINYNDGSSDIERFSYTYDAAGNRTGMTELDGSAYAWAYDNAYRLTSENFTPNGGATISSTFTYDQAGNRLTESIGGAAASHIYNGLDQLVTTTSGGVTTSYVYDERGNQISMSDGTDTTTYSYDALDRLTGVELPDTTAIAYTYDWQGNRVRQNAGGTITNYIWDEFSTYGDVVLETNASHAETARYVSSDCGCRSGDKRLISQTRSGATSYYLHDALGSTRALLDTIGTLTDTYRYDAFGTLRTSTGSTTNVYRFTGQQFDPLTGNYSLRARYYAPNTGRFLSRDTWPIDHQNPLELNRYVYAANNPVLFTDPSGYSLVENALQSFKHAVTAIKMNYAGTMTASTYTWLLGFGAAAGAVGYLAGVIAASIWTGKPVESLVDSRELLFAVLAGLGTTATQMYFNPILHNHWSKFAKHEWFTYTSTRGFVLNTLGWWVGEGLAASGAFMGNMTAGFGLLSMLDFIAFSEGKLPIVNTERQAFSYLLNYALPILQAADPFLGFDMLYLLLSTAISTFESKV